MKKNKYVLMIYLVLNIFSCDLQKDVDNKMSNESTNFVELIELMDKTIYNLNITLDKMLERVKENEKEITELKKKIIELENRNSIIHSN